MSCLVFSFGFRVVISVYIELLVCYPSYIVLWSYQLVQPAGYRLEGRMTNTCTDARAGCTGKVCTRIEGARLDDAAALTSSGGENGADKGDLGDGKADHKSWA